MAGEVADAPMAARVRLLDAVASVLDVDAAVLSDESSPATIQSWDSLNRPDIAMAMNRVGIALTAEQVMAMGDIGLICAALRRHGVEL
jgi:acyl carrier protein